MPHNIRHSIKITSPEGLAAFKRFYEIRKEIETVSDEVLERHAEEIKAINKKYNKLLRDQWRIIAEPYVDDPEQAAREGSWFLELNYWELHGDAFICKANAPPGTLEAFLESVKKAGDEASETIGAAVKKEWDIN